MLTKSTTTESPSGSEHPLLSVTLRVYVIGVPRFGEQSFVKQSTVGCSREVLDKYVDGLHRNVYGGVPPVVIPPIVFVPPRVTAWSAPAFATGRGLTVT